MAGGVIGGAIYAHKHKDELNKALSKSKKARGIRVSLGNKAYISSLKTGNAPKTKPVGISIAAGNKEYINSVRSKSPRKMYSEAMAAGKRYEDARKNLSILGKYGIGKTAKEYRSAQAASREATRAYYNSLTKKQYAKLRRNHVG